MVVPALGTEVRGSLGGGRRRLQRTGCGEGTGIGLTHRRNGPKIIRIMPSSRTLGAAASAWATAESDRAGGATGAMSMGRMGVTGVMGDGSWGGRASAAGSTVSNNCCRCRAAAAAVVSIVAAGCWAAPPPPPKLALSSTVARQRVTDGPGLL